MFSSKSPIKTLKNVITNTHDTIKKTVGENGWVAADNDTAVSCISIQSIMYKYKQKVYSYTPRR